MIAILRYLVLKTWRDSSLIAFVMIPVFGPVAALAGSTLAKGHFAYPLYLNVHYTPVQSATLAAQIAFAAAFMFSSISSFWTLRPEVATRAVGAFVLAARPFSIAFALVTFATAVAMTGWLGALGMIALLTSVLPAGAGMLMLKVFVASVAASAIGALVLMISAQPAMIAVGYMSCAVIIAFLEKAKDPTQLLTGVAVVIICVPLSAFLLERRCAT